MPDILMICAQNTNGSMQALCDGINKYTDYTADWVQLLPPNELYHEMGKDMTNPQVKGWLDEILPDVQVLHWNINEPQRYLPHYNFAPYLLDKINVKHYRGTQCRQADYHHTGFYDKVLVATPDLCRYHKDYVYWPLPIHLPDDVKPTWPDEFTPYHNPTWRRTLKEYRQLIKHSEWYPNLPDDEMVKGSKRIMEVTGLEEQPIRKWEDEIQDKAGCSVFIDQLYLGAHGVAAIEAMAMGKPTMCYISEYSRKIMFEWMDWTCPIFVTDWLDFKRDYYELKGLDLEYWGHLSQRWTEKFHDPALIAKRYVEMVLEGER